MIKFQLAYEPGEVYIKPESVTVIKEVEWQLQGMPQDMFIAQITLLNGDVYNVIAGIDEVKRKLDEEEMYYVPAD